MKIYVELTKHCIYQIKDRNPTCKTKSDAKKFWEKIFKQFIIKWEYNWNKIRVCYTRDWKYKITDWEHQFIYAKPYKIEYILITYVKREVILWKNLRPKERFII